jgi:hypothetical protein
LDAAGCCGTYIPVSFKEIHFIELGFLVSLRSFYSSEALIHLSF